MEKLYGLAVMFGLLLVGAVLGGIGMARGLAHLAKKEGGSLMIRFLPHDTGDEG